MALQNVGRGRKKIRKMPGARKRVILDTSSAIQPSAWLPDTPTAQFSDSVCAPDRPYQWLKPLTERQPRFCPGVAKLIVGYLEDFGIVTLFPPDCQPRCMSRMPVALEQLPGNGFGTSS
jgi:hypothetical protein